LVKLFNLKAHLKWELTYFHLTIINVGWTLTFHFCLHICNTSILRFKKRKT